MIRPGYNGKCFYGFSTITPEGPLSPDESPYTFDPTTFVPDEGLPQVIPPDLIPPPDYIPPENVPGPLPTPKVPALLPGENGGNGGGDDSKKWWYIIIGLGLIYILFGSDKKRTGKNEV